MALATTIRGIAKLFVVPFFYFVSVFPVGIAFVVVLTLTESYIGWRGYAPGFGADDLTTVYFNGDVVGIISLVLIGGLAFGLLSLGLVWLDRVRCPSLVDHLRQCAYPYAFVGIPGALFATEYVGSVVAGEPMYEMPKAVAVWVIAGFAIAVNALTPFWRYRRFAWAVLGSGA